MKAQIHNYSTYITETDPTKLKKHFENILFLAGFNVEGVVEKHFDPQGYTALFLLSESHFAIHTFPEAGQTYIELSSCIKTPFDYFIKLLC